jgi:hypothetical protein
VPIALRAADEAVRLPASNRDREGVSIARRAAESENWGTDFLIISQPIDPTRKPTASAEGGIVAAVNNYDLATNKLNAIR